MSKKSRKNPSKAATVKVAKSAVKSKVAKATKATAKTPAKATVKPAAKSPARKAVAKAAKTSAAKAPATKKPVVKATVKPKVPAVKKATAEKTVSKPVAKPVAESTSAPKTAAPKAASPKTALPKAPVPKPVQKIAPAIAVEGSPAPAFTLPRDGGASVALSDYAGRKLVIFFYPRASTPGCTKEAIDFTRLSVDFHAAGTAILGVSADPLKAQENFRDKHDLTMPLLSDTTQDMLKAYSAWGEKSMYGKVFEGVLRTTVLIDADGQVAKIWRSVKVDGHADAVLEEARRI